MGPVESAIFNSLLARWEISEERIMNGEVCLGLTG